MKVAPDATSQSVTMYAWSATTGLPYTTAAFGDAGIALWYKRGSTGATTAITPVTQTDTGAWSSGGFVTVGDNTIRFDVPNAAFAAGVPWVEIGGSATAWKLTSRTIELETPQSGDAYARLGAPANASIAADLAAIEAQTDDIGAAGAGLTALGDARLANLDAAVSSRSTYAGGAVASVTGNVGGNVTGSVGSVTGSVGSVASGGITAASIATGAIDADALTADAAAEIADTVLRRTMANIEASANGDTLSVESLYGLIAAAFESAVSGTTWTVRKSDGSTLGTKTVATDAAADPVVSVT